MTGRKKLGLRKWTGGSCEKRGKVECLEHQTEYLFLHVLLSAFGFVKGDSYPESCAQRITEGGGSLFSLSCLFYLFGVKHTPQSSVPDLANAAMPAAGAS
jgi:hypothetical protein